MPKSTTFCNDFLNLILRGTAITDLAENDTSSPTTSVYLSLHTATPGIGGLQTTNEATYTPYVRLAVSRTGAGWAVASGGATSNSLLSQFVECASGSDTVTHVAVGTDSSGAGKVLWAGALAASRSISAGIQPQFAIAALTITEA